MAFSFTGGIAHSGSWYSVSVRSWKIFRFIAILLALGFLLFRHREQSGIQIVEEFLDRHGAIFLLILSVYATALLVSHKLTQHYSFRTGAYDLSMYEYALHNTIEGRFMEAFGIQRNFFSEHASPILPLLLPVYFVFRSPVSLLVMQSILVALALVPLYGISRYLTLTKLQSLLVCTAYLLNVFLWRAFVFDFHVELLLPVCMFSCYWAFLRSRWTAFYAMGLLSLSIKEDMAILVITLMLFAALAHHRGLRHLATLTAVSLVWTYVAWGVVIPNAYPEARHESHFIDRWSHLGETMPAVSLKLATSPVYVISKLCSQPVAALFVSTGCLPFATPMLAALFVPNVLWHVTSNYEYQATLGVYYGLTSVLLLILTIPYAIRRLDKRFGTTVGTVAALLPLIFAPEGKFPHTIEQRDSALRKALRVVPINETIEAQANIIPHIPPAPTVSLYAGDGTADWILFGFRSIPLAPFHRGLHS